jgi:predicted DNA-binding transcriptional regulator AlpA
MSTTTPSKASTPTTPTARRGAETVRQPVPCLLLTDDEAAATLGIGMTTFHELRKRPWFPAPIQLGPRLVRWSLAEIEDAIAQMPRQREPSEPAQLLRGKINRLKGAAEHQGSEAGAAAFPPPPNRPGWRTLR